jgi:hypothetical protein
VKEDLDRMNAVHAGRLVAVARQHLQRRQHQQRDKRGGFPYVDGDD